MSETIKTQVARGAIVAFLQAVLRHGQTGWPVNAYMIGPEVFKGDHAANFAAIRAVLKECEAQQFLVVTSGGEIQSMSDTAKALAR